MSIPMPAACANPDCIESVIKPIHCSSRRIAIDAVDGPPVFAQHVTYRCAQCGCTWAVQGFASEDSSLTFREFRTPAFETRNTSRDW